MSSIVGRWASAQLSLMEELQHDLGARDHQPARRPPARPAGSRVRPTALTWLLRVLTGQKAAAAR